MNSYFGLVRTGLFVFAGKSLMIEALPLSPPTVNPKGSVEPVDIPTGQSFSGLVVSQCALSQ